MPPLPTLALRLPVATFSVLVQSQPPRSDEPARQPARPTVFPASEGWRPLFNGKDLAGWKFRNPRAKKVWIVCDDVRLDPADSSRLSPVGRGGNPSAALLCGDDGRGSDIMTEESFADYQLHIEFTVPKGSKLGRLQPRAFRDPGLRQLRQAQARAFTTAARSTNGRIPRENLSKPPGEWQSYDITFKGKKLTLALERQAVYKDMDVRYGETDRDAFERLNQENAGKPAELQVKLREENGRYVGYFGEGGTRSGLDGPDRPGPILLQGDHGPVAYRNIFIR